MHEFGVREYECMNYFQVIGAELAKQSDASHGKTIASVRDHDSFDCIIGMCAWRRSSGVDFRKSCAEFRNTCVQTIKNTTFQHGIS